MEEIHHTKRRSKRVIAIRTVVVVLLIVGIWIGGIVGYGYLTVSADFKNDSEIILKAITSGKAQDVYREAAPAFRETMREERLVDMAATIVGSLGNFRRIVDVVDAGERSVPSGRIGYTKLSVEFANATTDCELSFQRLHGKWRLLGLEVASPADAKIRETIDALRSRPQRLAAPTEVVDDCKALVGLLASGKADEVYQNAAPSFREAMSVEEFQSLIKRRESQVGKLAALESIVSSAQNRAMNEASVVALVQFANTRGGIALSYINLDGTWLLAKFRFTDSPALAQ